MIATITPIDLRERLRFIELVAIADTAHEERRQEARQAALRAFDAHEPACVFRLRFMAAMHTGRPF